MINDDVPRLTTPPHDAGRGFLREGRQRLALVVEVNKAERNAELSSKLAVGALLQQGPMGDIAERTMSRSQEATHHVAKLSDDCALSVVDTHELFERSHGTSTVMSESGKKDSRLILLYSNKRRSATE